MSSRTLVVVYEQNDEKRGEITIVENAQKAARLVETLLEAGFERERIRIFTGGEMSMQVTLRPVVALVDGGSAVTQASSETIEEAPKTSKAEVEAEAVLVKAAANDAPLTRDGVRFSQAFRPA
jgi:predicted ribonuclease YlaK